MRTLSYLFGLSCILFSQIASAQTLNCSWANSLGYCIPCTTWASAYFKSYRSHDCIACGMLCKSIGLVTQEPVTEVDRKVKLIKAVDRSDEGPVLHGLTSTSLLEIARVNPAAATSLAMFLPGSPRAPITLAQGSASASRAPTFTTVEVLLTASSANEEAVVAAIESSRMPERDGEYLKTEWVATRTEARYAIRFDSNWRARNREETRLGRAFPSILVFVSETKPRQMLGWAAISPEGDR